MPDVGSEPGPYLVVGGYSGDDDAWPDSEGDFEPELDPLGDEPELEASGLDGEEPEPDELPGACGDEPVGMTGTEVAGQTTSIVEVVRVLVWVV